MPYDYKERFVEYKNDEEACAGEARLVAGVESWDDPTFQPNGDRCARRPGAGSGRREPRAPRWL